MMKKMLSGIMAGLVGLFGVGCHNQQPNEPNVTADDSTEHIETSVSDHSESDSYQEESVTIDSETISKKSTTETFDADVSNTESEDDLDQVTSQAVTESAPEIATQTDEPAFDEFGNEEL